MTSMKQNVVIIGAGAAGLMCSIECGKRSRSVAVLEKSDRIGSKIRISGGGKCNFTNRYSSEKNFLSSNPHFPKSALARFSPQDMIQMVEKHGVRIYEKKLGQIFCKDGAQEIINMLKQECDLEKVEIKLNCKITEIKKNDCFEINTSLGTFYSDSLVVATGGLSMPKIGASSFGYEIARQFGLKVLEHKPALVPLKWNKKDLLIFKELAGISIDTIACCGDHSFRENILFTHKGLSGPAILQVSLYWKERQPISINLFPQKELFPEFRAHCKEKVQMSSFLRRFFPKRFVQVWCKEFIQSRPMNQYSEKELREIAHQIHCWQIIPEGRDGYDIAEVTVGGVDTNELSSKTMESKKVAGLYFIGEVMDVTGELGGHNFQWAWSSGFAAGQFA